MELRRVVLALVVMAAVLGPALGFLPGVVPTVVRAHGVAVEGAWWCAEGLCVGPAHTGRITAASGVLGWDGVLRLVSVRVASDQGAAGVVARAEPPMETSAAELPRIPFVRRVEVTDLVVEGTPLPALSGEVLPERHLVGEGARVDGDEAELTLDTEWGAVEVRVAPGERAGVHTIEARCACTFTSPALGGTLADRAVSFRGELDGDEVSGEARVEGVAAQVEAHVGGTAVATGRFLLPETDLAAVYAIFAPLVPELARADVRGTVSARGRFSLRPFSVHVEPVLAGFQVDGLVSDAYRYGTFTWMGRDAKGGYVPRHGGDEAAGWASLPAMGELLPMAVIAAEDASFLQHAGFDLQGMLTAAEANSEAGEVVRGGSTLTQQLAKNLFLTGDRTYARKLRELLYAVEMERELGKRRILELYLNVVEWGPDVVGGHAAAEAYFLKSPVGLTPEEAAFLASILRNPRGGWAREYVGGRVNGRRLAWILDNMVGLDPAVRRAALDRDVHFVPPAPPSP